MRKTAFLSIDMDIVTTHFGVNFYPNQTKRAKETIAEIERLTHNQKKIVVPAHHFMLDYINKHEADTLINIDEHSDIAESDGKTHLNCGTWVNFVKWRRNAEYIWLHGSRNYLSGLCHGDQSLTVKTCNKEWRRVNHRAFYHNLDREYRIIGLAVCISNDWLLEDCRELIGNFCIKEFNIPKNWITDHIPFSTPRDSYLKPRVIKHHSIKQ